MLRNLFLFKENYKNTRHDVHILNAHFEYLETKAFSIIMFQIKVWFWKGRKLCHLFDLRCWCVKAMLILSRSFYMGIFYCIYILGANEMISNSGFKPHLSEIFSSYKCCQYTCTICIFIKRHVTPST